MYVSLDTEPAKSLIPKSLYRENFANLKLDLSGVTLRTSNNETIEHVGRLNCDVNYDGQSAQLSALIVKGDTMPLLGRDWITVLKLDWANIFASSVNERSSVKSVIDNQYAMFDDGMGTIKGHKAHVYMKYNAQPKFHKARHVPDAIRDKVKAELIRLETEKIIQKVDHTDWAAPSVVVPKADKTMRICGDFKVTINPNVEIEHYPTYQTYET